MSVRREPHHREGNEQIAITLGQKADRELDAVAKTLTDELKAFGVMVDDVVQEVFDEVGKEAVRKLKETSPVNPKGKHSGRYAKGWTYERAKKVKGVNMSYVRNKTDPQLTHLLEYGHPLVRNGKVVGNVQANPHINPVAQWCAEEANNRLIKKLGG